MFTRKLLELILVKVIVLLPESNLVNILRKCLLWIRSDLPLVALARANETVVHVGCWKIETVCRWSRLVGAKGKVIIIEAIRENVKALEFEAKRRSLNNVIFINSGVWNSKGEVTMMVHKGTWMKDSDKKKILDKGQLFLHSRIKDASTYIDEDTPEYNVNYEEEKIRVDTLDNLLRQVESTEPDHIHLTVTGSEYEVIWGMENLLRNKAIRIIASSTFLRKDDNRPSHEAVGRLLRQKGLIICLGRRIPGRHGRYLFAYKK